MSITMTPPAGPMAPPMPIAPVTVPPPLPTWPPLHRITVADYHRMGEIGLLTPEHRVELFEGLIVEKPVFNTPHIAAFMHLIEWWYRLGVTGFSYRPGISLTLDTGEPETDGCIVIGATAEYQHRKPAASDTVVVIEISDSTLNFDRGDKLRVYARNGIATYWIVNLLDKQIEVYTQPYGGESPGYGDTQVFSAGGKVPLVLNGATVAEVAVDDIIK